MDLGWNPAAVPHAPELLPPAQGTARPGRRDPGASAGGMAPCTWSCAASSGSASNLAAYIALRRHDLARLSGGSRARPDLARPLRRPCGRDPRCRRPRPASDAGSAGEGRPTSPAPPAPWSATACCLYRNTNRLLGMPPGSPLDPLYGDGPRAAGADYAFVRELMEQGMDCCARELRPGRQGGVARHHRQCAPGGKGARPQLQGAHGARPVRKLRTGPVDAGPPVLHVKVKRDQFGDPCIRP